MATEKRLISLDEAIAKIKDDGLLGSGYSDEERMGDVIDMLESCHIVDAVEVVHGKWIPTEYSDPEGGKYYLFHCSECCTPNARQRNYCPNCGAKMNGEKV